MNSLTGFEGALANGNIRRTPDGKQVAVVDLIMHLTGKPEIAARITATRLKNKYLELVSFFDTYAFSCACASDMVSLLGTFFQLPIQFFPVLPIPKRL